jgi:hypothetical protein
MFELARRRRAAGVAAVLLGFTGTRIAAAQSPQETPLHPAPVTHKNWVDDPYAPHHTDGTSLRVGSAVGPIAIDDRRYTALGAVVAVGRRVGLFSFDLEYDYLTLQDPGPSTLVLGRAQNLALVGRVDLLRLDSHYVGANSMVALYIEGAVQRTMYHYYTPTAAEAPRAVAADSERTQAAFGFGALLDHRLEEPLGFPNRVGWQLGWRLATTPRDEHDAMISCKGCLAAHEPGPMMSRIYDTELIVTSTIDFTW